jgi:hypothetical protein
MLPSFTVYVFVLFFMYYIFCFQMFYDPKGEKFHDDLAWRSKLRSNFTISSSLKLVFSCFLSDKITVILALFSNKMNEFLLKFSQTY